MELTQRYGSDDKSIYNPTTDKITCIKPSNCNKYLFTGDSGGRIVAFKKKQMKTTNLWEPKNQFFGTEPHFDYLTSMNSDNKITGIIPLQYNDNCMNCIVSDTKNIYFHKLFNTKRRISYKWTPFKITNKTKTTVKHRFLNGHKFYINSIALSKDFEYILSADDLNINMWHINRPDRAIPVIDTTPKDLSSLTNTITKMKIDPLRENLIYTSSSNGIISVFDMRIKTTTDTPIKIMYSSKMISYDSIEHITGNVFEKKNSREHLKYISDFDISNDSNYIVTRSPLFINIWDLRNTLNPCHSYPIHKQIYSLIKHNCDVAYEPFEINYSSDGKYIYSGSFDNIICINTQTNDISDTNNGIYVDVSFESPRHTCVKSCMDSSNVFSTYNGILSVFQV